ncbi:MAG: hypothetical protein GYA35_03660, partial [Thermoanaerobaculaceae bacterium]|nr:hypothetical protein [Thermoanaerobaculaceae bacterium]
MFEGKIRYFLIVLLLMAAFVATSYEVHSPDCFWHLAFGKVFVENRHFVRNEPFAFTTMGKDIYVTSWLYDFFSYLVFEHFGYSGLELSIRLLAVFVMFVLIKIATMESVEGLVHIIIYYSLFFRLFGSRFRARPESFIILLYAFLICLLFLYRKEKLKHLWLFPVVFLIWVQIHPSWVYGMLIIPLFIIEKHGFSLSKKSLKDLVFMVILPTFSLFFNPYGYKPFLFPFVSYLTMRSQSKIYSIGEWQPLKWTFFSTPFLILPIVLLLLFAFKYLKKEENLFPILFICIQTFFLLAWERYATFAFIGLSFFAFSFIGYIINMAPRFKKAIYSFSVVLLFLP